MAALLGKPFMPWQQYVADVVLEIDPLTGRLAYSEFGLTVPRQSGKSSWVLAKAIQRGSATGFFGRRQQLVYTAQSRQKAREKWEEDFSAQIEAAKAFASKVRIHKAYGNEHMRFGNGSRFGIEANTEKAGHGVTLDEAYIDEAFAQVDGRLEQAFRPAMITRPNKQLGVISTAGWEGASPFLWAKTLRGRELADSGVTRGTAYFEWSAPPDADPYDRDVWRACMPALGLPALGFTITEDAIAQELAMAENLANFRRAYLNQWVPRPTGDGSVLDPALWRTGEGERPSGLKPGALAVAASLDLTSASVAAAASVGGLVHVSPLEYGSGIGWVVDRVRALQDEHRVPVVIDGRGPAAVLVPLLERERVTLRVVKTSDVFDACAGLVDLVREGRLRHPVDDPLDSAAAAAVKHNVGDRWVWGRKGADSSPLEAATLAAWAVAHGVPARSAYEDHGLLVV